MKDYSSLSPKQKFIRSCIATVVFLAILLGFWMFCSQYFIIGTGWLIKFIIVTVLVLLVSVVQIVATYQAWKRGA